MRKAPRIFLAISALAVLSLSAGCGGDGDSDNDITNSIFAGTYGSGTFTATGEASGTASGTVSTSGQLDANLVLTSENNEEGSLRGTIQQNGSFSGELNSPSLPAQFRPISITGEFEKTANGIRGEFSRTINGQAFTATVTLNENAD